MRLFGQSWVFALWQLVHLDFAGFNPLESFYMFFLYLPRFSSAESQIRSLDQIEVRLLARKDRCGAVGPRVLLSGDRELLKTHESNLPTCGRTSGNLRVQKTRSLSSCPSQGTNLASLGSRAHPWPGAPESLFPVTVVGESAPGRLFPRLSLPPRTD